MDASMIASTVMPLAAVGTHTVLVIDLQLKANFDDVLFVQCVDSILAFGTSLLMQSGANKLTILGSSTVANTVLYIDEEADKPEVAKHFEVPGQQMEKFARISSHTKANFAKWLQQCASPTPEAFKVSMLSGGLSQGLCLINRHKSDFANNRIVIFSLSCDQSDLSYSSQYMQLINCFFAAQKSNVILDACSCAVSRSNEERIQLSSASMEDRFAASILQQGADLTGGRYIRVHKMSTLLEHLFWHFLPTTPEQRELYVLPAKLRISPPAACFCHRKVLDVGYVCSVCVSIFCQYVPYCTTCNSNIFANSLKKVAQLKAADPNTSSISC